MSFLAAALAFVLPVPCVGCGTEGRVLCDGCRGALAPHLEVRDVSGVGRVVAGTRYDGVARAALLALKEHGATGLATALAVPFAAAVAAAIHGAGDVALAAVPTTRAARRRRGYEPVRVLAERAGIRMLPLFAPARPHAAQKLLGVDERARNLTAAFATARPVEGRRVVLLDDVVTTGATLVAASAALREAGAVVAGAAVVAATPRRHPLSAGTPSLDP